MAKISEMLKEKREMEKKGYGGSEEHEKVTNKIYGWNKHEKHESKAQEKKEHVAKKIDMKAWMQKQAAKGHNPFSLVTHINGKKIK